MESSDFALSSICVLYEVRKGKEKQAVSSDRERGGYKGMALMMNERMNERTDGWMDGWMDGGSTVKETKEKST